ELAPKKCNCRREPGRTDAPVERSATLAAPMANGLLPIAFEKRTRSWSPPMVTCTIWRRVTWSKVTAAPNPASLYALQLPTPHPSRIGVVGPRDGSPKREARKEQQRPPIEMSNSQETHHDASLEARGLCESA